MNNNLKIFLTIFLISLPFWWGVNVFHENMEKFFYQREITGNPSILASIAYQAELEEKLEQMRPTRIKNYQGLETSALSAISVFIDNQGKERILFEKNSQERMPIASLTKLMTAYVALKNYDLPEEMEKELYLALIESNNEAALNLARTNGETTFIKSMNLEAESLGMENTFFINPTGLDGENNFNYSTALDLVKLAKHLTEEKHLILEISTLAEFEDSVNTNRLLGEISGIIGGKTGETRKSGDCLLLIIQAPQNKGHVINVVLNSQDRFEEMKKLIDWTQHAYRW